MRERENQSYGWISTCWCIVHKMYNHFMERQREKNVVNMWSKALNLMRPNEDEENTIFTLNWTNLQECKRLKSVFFIFICSPSSINNGKRFQDSVIYCAKNVCVCVLLLLLPFPSLIDVVLLLFSYVFLSAKRQNRLQHSHTIYGTCIPPMIWHEWMVQTHKLSLHQILPVKCKWIWIGYAIAMPSCICIHIFVYYGIRRRFTMRLICRSDCVMRIFPSLNRSQDGWKRIKYTRVICDYIHQLHRIQSNYFPI